MTEQDIPIESIETQTTVHRTGFCYVLVETVKEGYTHEFRKVRLVDLKNYSLDKIDKVNNLPIAFVKEIIQP